jgi:hypothetical protein
MHETPTTELMSTDKHWKQKLSSLRKRPERAFRAKNEALSLQRVEVTNHNAGWSYEERASASEMAATVVAFYTRESRRSVGDARLRLLWVSA